MKVHAAVAALVLLLVATGAYGAGMLQVQDNPARSVKDLSGIWRFKEDKHNVGVTERWWLRPLAAPLLQMPVPASYNDITQDNELRRHIGWVWYERDFFVPHTWVSTGQRIVLRFESVSYAASVWVDGTAVVSHAGGHLPFEADITQLVKGTARSRLTVAVNNTLTPFTLPPGNVRVEHGSRYPKGYTVQETHFDFFNYAGIDREVYLYTTPSQWIDDITLTYDIQPNGDATVNYEIAVANASSTQGEEGNLIPGSRPATPAATHVRLINGDGVVVAQSAQLNGSLVVPRDALTLWQPGKPYLYTLEVTADDDVYHLRSVGIRTIKVSGAQFLINGKPFYFHGVDKHEDSDIRGKGVDDVIVVKDYNMLQWLNVSAYRTSHYPYAAQFYDMADERGIVIIDECPAVGLAEAEYFNPTTLAHHKQVMYEMIRRDKNHPSVVMWNVANEPRSDMHVAYNYFKEVAAYTRETDPTRRPITLVNNVDYTQQTCAEFFDVVCINRYYAWYSDSGQLEVIPYQLDADLQGFWAKYKKPIIVSEYGADTVPGLHHDPAFMFTEDFQVAFLKQYHKVFDRYIGKFLIGELVWNFADFRTGQSPNRVGASNLKGVLTRQREPKPAAYTLKERYSHLKKSLPALGHSSPLHNTKPDILA